MFMGSPHLIHNPHNGELTVHQMKWSRISTSRLVWQTSFQPFGLRI
jgi:hypothetical protein